LTADLDKHIKQIGENIRDSIAKSNYKAIEISQKLGVDNSTISMWMSGKRTPTIKNLIELSRVLQIDISTFLFNVGEPFLSKEHQEIIKILTKLKSSQVMALLEITKSMLPPPDLQEIIKIFSNLTAKQKKALIEFVDLKNV